MKILLTGINGQVGWELQRTLCTLGEVVGLDRQGLDLSDPDAIRAVVRDVRPELIVNSAAYTAVDKAESEADLAMAINGTAPGILAEEAKRLGAAVVHYSTDYVFDGAKDSPYLEDDAPCPINVYGKTKLAGEEAVRAAGAPYLILRTSWVYGARGKNFLLTVRRLAAERDELKIVGDQIGAPTWSRMIAEASAQILVQCRSGVGDRAGAYHLTAAGETSWYGFTRAILDLAPHGPQPRVVPIATPEYPLPAPRPLYSRLSNEKLARTFGVALPPWETGLALCAA